MLDVSFTELMLIGIVALVVIGPERLPKVARTAGHLFGRLQRYVSDVKADISREMQLDELKQLKSDLQESARGFERSMSSEMQAIEKSANQVVQSAQSQSVETAPADGGVSATEHHLASTPESAAEYSGHSVSAELPTSEAQNDAGRPPASVQPPQKG